MRILNSSLTAHQDLTDEPRDSSPKMIELLHLVSNFINVYPRDERKMNLLY
jgi:hypothetical protein